MMCSNCDDDFPESQIEESHDVPCYLFEGNRQSSKNQADKFPRRYLCGGCHKTYEDSLRLHLRILAQRFAQDHFTNKEEDEYGGFFH